jgi:hypothetical protein
LGQQGAALGLDFHRCCVELGDLGLGFRLPLLEDLHLAAGVRSPLQPRVQIDGDRLESRVTGFALAQQPVVMTTPLDQVPTGGVEAIAQLLPATALTVEVGVFGGRFPGFAQLALGLGEVGGKLPGGLVESGQTRTVLRVLPRQPGLGLARRREIGEGLLLGAPGLGGGGRGGRGPVTGVLSFHASRLGGGGRVGQGRAQFGQPILLVEPGRRRRLRPGHHGEPVPAPEIAAAADQTLANGEPGGEPGATVAIVDDADLR